MGKFRNFKIEMDGITDDIVEFIEESKESVMKFNMLHIIREVDDTRDDPEDFHKLIDRLDAGEQIDGVNVVSTKLNYVGLVFKSDYYGDRTIYGMLLLYLDREVSDEDLLDGNFSENDIVHMTFINRDDVTSRFHLLVEVMRVHADNILGR